MSYTSERVDPSEYTSSLEDRLIFLLHQQTYQFAVDYVKDKVMLDLGCGDGYGANMLAAAASSITAVDVSSETIEDAKAKYPHPKITFQAIDSIEANALPLADGAFDVVTSFQVVEHIKNVEHYFKEIERVLKKGGHALIATPNAAVRLLPFQNPWNRFHFKEFTCTELAELAGKYFQVEKRLSLSFKEPWLSVERRRARKNKWILYPATIKLIPHRLRVALLQAAWDLKKKRKAGTKVSRREGQQPVAHDVLIGPEDNKSPCFILVCQKK